MTPVLALLLASVTPNAFKTDLCTAYPEGTPEHPMIWAHCCIEHDLHYWAGGTQPMEDEADLALRDCVRATGEKTQAELIYAGVRLGHLSPGKLPNSRWGNAWNMLGNFRPLRREEVEAIGNVLPLYPWLPEGVAPRLMETLYRSLDENPPVPTVLTPNEDTPVAL